MINKTTLYNYAKSFGVELDETALERFDIYAALLADWNTKINLTAITDPEGIVLKHFADSLSIFSVVDFPRGAKVIDVGTGAGFPGVAMKIARPDLEITLLDSTRKKLNVIEDILEHIGLECTLVHGRAEEYQKQKNFKESFDYSVARAVANLKTLSGWTMPFVKKGGTFISMKGAKAREEIAESEKTIAKLGGKIAEVRSFELGDAGERNIILINK